MRRWLPFGAALITKKVFVEVQFLKTTRDSIKTRFTSAADLMLALTHAYVQNDIKAVMRRTVKAYSLLVLDEIGYIPMIREQPSCSSRK